MNIVRTRAVELTIIPAIAYKQKLASGGAGIKIMRLDSDKTAVCTIDKRTGEAKPYGNAYDESLFSADAFDEAIELTSGMPYSGRGKIKLSHDAQPEQEDIAANTEADKPEMPDMLSSDEYTAIVERYSDEKGKMNYQLMNKDSIQFASKSKIVADMVDKMADPDDIIVFIVKSRSALIAGKKESLDDEMTKMLIETLDEIDPRSAFKELKAYIIRQLAKRGKN